MYNLGQTPQFVILSCYMIETGSFSNMHHRGYNTGVSGTAMQLFENAVAGQSYVSANTLAGIAGQIITPTAYSLGEVAIENGWQTRRLRFVTHVQAGTSEWIVTGFTSHSDITATGLVDPNMRMYINNVISIHAANGFDGVYRRRVHEVNHILNNPKFGNLTMGGFAGGIGMNPMMGGMSGMGMPGMLPGMGQIGNATENWQTLRPQDILGYRSFVEKCQTEGNQPVQDLRLFGGGVSGKQFSRRSNCQSADYLARALGSITSAENNTDENITMVHGYELFNQAKNMSSEALVMMNPFLAFLTNYTSYKAHPWFTYNEICSLIPTLDQMTKVWPVAEATRSGSFNPMGFNVPDVSDPGSIGANWGASSNNARLATIVGYSVTSIMADLAIKTIGFNSDNQNVQLIPQTVLSPNSMSLLIPGIDEDQKLAQMFLDRFNIQVIPEIAYSNGFPINYILAVRIDLFGNSFITVQTEGEGQELFTLPSFADALMPPVITTNPNTPLQIATDIATLASTPAFGATYARASR